MIGFFNWFTKITAFIVQKLCFRTKIYYENKSQQGRRIKGPAIIISNHTSVYDYAVFLFVFFSTTLRYQMAEVLFKKRLLRNFLKCMGGIFVDRDSNDFGFIDKSQKILSKGGVVGIFPEGRIPEKEEVKPLSFKSGATHLALISNVPIIPVYTNGAYFQKKRAKIIIGKPIYLSETFDSQIDYKENLEKLSNQLRDKIINLKKLLEEKTEDEKAKKKNK